MIGWQAQVSPRRRRIEAAGWTAAAGLVLGTVAAGTALALIYDPAGTGGREQVVMMELPPLPAAEAVAEVPEAAPDIPQPDTPEMAPPEAETPPEALPDLPPPRAEAPPDLAPPPDMAAPERLAEPLPDTASPEPPPPSVEPPVEPPVETAEVALPDSPRPPERPETQPEPVPPKPDTPQPDSPRREARKRPEPERAPDRQAERATERREASAGQAAAPAARGSASASEIERWTGRVQGQLARHMQRRRFAPGTVLLQLTIDSAGRVTGASVLQAQGAGGLEAEILAHARRIGRVTAPPPGAPTTLRVPVQVR
ncbi:TonB family protein [Frigidibacter sp. MR17.14]|uniref:energy transducer TonB family protein n=1 Tax=Frigidibacter sp. MR17.14 TaxID=3126509 RepID=UPI003012BB03